MLRGGSVRGRNVRLDSNGRPLRDCPAGKLNGSCLGRTQCRSLRSRPRPSRLRRGKTGNKIPASQVDGPAYRVILSIVSKANTATTATNVPTTSNVFCHQLSLLTHRSRSPAKGSYSVE